MLFKNWKELRNPVVILTGKVKSLVAGADIAEFAGFSLKKAHCAQGQDILLILSKT
jgi:enoyl-CoA hydratase/carnithine racemase